jgi:hypothetical protein
MRHIRINVPITDGVAEETLHQLPLSVPTASGSSAVGYVRCVCVRGFAWIVVCVEWSHRQLIIFTIRSGNTTSTKEGILVCV